MSKRGLRSTLSTKKLDKQVKLTMDVLSYFDGKTSLLEIAENLNVPIWELYQVIDQLESYNLINTD